MVMILLTLFACRDIKREIYLHEHLESDNQRIAMERENSPLWPLPERLPTLQWSAARYADQLTISYEVFNPGDESVWILDGLPDGPDALLVARGLSYESAVLVKGVYACCTYTYTGERMNIQAHELKPGTSLTGRGVADLPLRPNVDSATTQYLRGDVDDITLEVAWMMEDERHGPLFLGWEPLPWLPQNAAHARQRWIVSDPLPMPD